MERFAFGVRLQIVWIGGDGKVRQGPAEGGEERRGELVGVFGCGCRMSSCCAGGGERSVVAALRSRLRSLRRGVVLEEAASE